MSDTTLSAAKAVIRDGLPAVAMSGDRAGKVAVRFRFLRGKDEAGVIERTWPDDFRFKDDGATGRATLREATAFEPYTEVRVQADGKDLKPGSGWGLNKLYALSDDDFEGIFFRARDRPQDKETQHFATRQITEHYRLNASHRAVAAVVQAYRAIDLAKPEMTDAAVAVLQQELATAGELPESWRARLDGVHLQASLRSVLWQLHLFRGENDAVMAELDRLVAFLKEAHEPLPYISINGCPAILVRAHLMLAEGRSEEASELGFWNADFYLGCLTRLKKRRKLWQELIPPYRLVMTSMDLAQRVIDKEDQLAARAVITEAMRVEGDQPSAEIMVQNYEALNRRLRSRRRAEAEKASAQAG